MQQIILYKNSSDPVSLASILTEIWLFNSINRGNLRKISMARLALIPFRIEKIMSYSWSTQKTTPRGKFSPRSGKIFWLSGARSAQYKLNKRLLKRTFFAECLSVVSLAVVKTKFPCFSPLEIVLTIVPSHDHHFAYSISTEKSISISAYSIII